MGKHIQNLVHLGCVWKGQSGHQNGEWKNIWALIRCFKGPSVLGKMEVTAKGKKTLAISFLFYTVLVGLANISCPIVVGQYERPLLVTCKKFMMEVYGWSLLLIDIPSPHPSNKGNQRKQKPTNAIVSVFQ